MEQIRIFLPKVPNQVLHGSNPASTNDMILRFEFENFLSFSGKQQLSMVASSLRDYDQGLIANDVLGPDSVLPAIIIYGANASGKSNIIAALEFFRGAILQSYRADPDAPPPVIPFRLDPSKSTAPSRFGLDFILSGIRHQYGFCVTSEGFVNEWLYVYPRGVRQTLFERNKQSFKFGRALKGRNKVISELTRANSLFLSSAYQNDHEQLSNIGRYFRSISVNHFDTGFPREIHHALRTELINEAVIKFLNIVGTGIVNYQVNKVEFSERFQSVTRAILSAAELDESLINSMIEDATKENRLEIKLGHLDSLGNTVFFDIDQESSGTQRLVPMVSRIFENIRNGTLLVIDEFDASLHTQICEKLLELFCSRVANPKGAQIIVTTHDTNLLRAPFLRRDQVWLVEKDDHGASDLYPLTDVRTLKGDNIEKGYLQGRFGAVPAPTDLTDLLAN